MNEQTYPNWLANRKDLYCFWNATDRDVLRSLIIGEAEGESADAMLAVAYTVTNRANRKQLGLVSHWPNSVKGNALYKNQYTCFWYDFNKRIKSMSAALTMDTDSPIYNRIVLADKLAVQAIERSVEDPSCGADHYFATRIARPKWANLMRKTATKGGHVFYSSI